VKIGNDGFDLGAQRRPIDKNDLPAALKFLQIYKSKAAATPVSPQVHPGGSSGGPLAHAVLKSEIAKSGDYYLTGDRYRSFEHHKVSTWPVVELGEVCKIYQPETITSKEIKSEGSYKVFGANGVIGFYEKYNHENPEVLITCRGATCGTINLSEPKCWITGNAMVVSPLDNRINKIYLYYLLKASDLSSVISGTAQPQITRIPLSPFKIPLPPLEVQEKIVAEIDGYQKIIDAARQITQAYKPTIKINPNWPMVELEGLTDIVTGKLDSNKAVPNGKYPFFTCSKEILNIDDYAFDCEALLLAGNNAAGVFDIKYYKGKFNAYQRTYVITVNRNSIAKIDYQFLRYQLEQHLELLKRKSIGSSTRYLTIGMINTLQIATPPLSDQKQIVERIEEEQKIINENKKLIEIFQNKISAAISALWA
ncbi:MAG TPA: restriction endonuclease subunit S, partial [Sedimentisphaerales bacterium]|nr:restriction endonuclease subunit S [Sedimentisphaerales bacterium]